MTIELDVGSAATGHDVVDLAREGIARALAETETQAIAARVRLVGATPAHAALVTNPDQYANEIRVAATDVDDGIFIENVVFSTHTTLDLPAIRTQNDAIGELARSLDAMKHDPSALALLATELADVKLKLPLELREGDGALAFDDAHLRAILADVEEVLIPRLLTKEAGR